MNSPGQVIKQLKAEFLKRITPFPETKTTPEDTKVFNFVVGCFNDAAADVLIAAYEPISPYEPITQPVSEDAKRTRIEKAKKTREENKRKKAEREARRRAKKLQKMVADLPTGMEPELVEV